MGLAWPFLSPIEAPFTTVSNQNSLKIRKIDLGKHSVLKRKNEKARLEALLVIHNQVHHHPTAFGQSDLQIAINLCVYRIRCH